MIKIKRYDAICADIVATIEGLEGYVRVVYENQATKKLGDRVGVQLVAVVPSASRTGANGRGVDNNVAYFFIMKKPSSDANNTNELNDQEQTQDITLAIRDYVEEKQESGCADFSRMDTSTVNIDPEFNAFGGWNGWSLTFIF
ncbi:MAG: hypothetical protein JXR07_19935 [Reichenbachiella sp.]